MQNVMRHIACSILVLSKVMVGNKIKKCNCDVTVVTSHPAVMSHPDRHFVLSPGAPLALATPMGLMGCWSIWQVSIPHLRKLKAARSSRLPPASRQDGKTAGNKSELCCVGEPFMTLL